MDDFDFLLGKKIAHVEFCDVDGLSLRNNSCVRLIVDDGSKIEIIPTAEVPVGEKFEQLGLSLRIVDKFMAIFKWPGGPAYEWAEIDVLEPYLNLLITDCATYDSIGDGLISALQLTFEDMKTIVVEHSSAMSVDVKLEDKIGTIGRVIALLRSLDPNLHIELDETASYSRIQFGSAPGAEYRVVLYVFDEVESQIRMQLVNEEEHECIWRWTFKKADFKSQADFQQEFVNAVGYLVTSRTRLTQKRGLVKNRIRCEVESGEAWLNFGPIHKASRLGVKVSPTLHNIVCYESPAVIPR